MMGDPMGCHTDGDVVATGDVVEGRYRIIKTLGAGGMGTVFLAEHALIKRRVALKILHPHLATDAGVVERFMNEARAAGTLGHPNIVESTDMGFTQDQVPYIVFEYLEGTLLTDEIYRVGGLPVHRAVRIATQIASALEAAHRAGIVHRDLKSDNVYLTDKDDALDHVKVLDFGVSRFIEIEDTQRGMVVGTPEFMAPEQIMDPEHVDKRADIYALGVILYEMLEARRPFSVGHDPRLLMDRICTTAPPPLLRREVPHGLSVLILDRLLAKDREERYGTMGDVQAALEQFITRGDGTPLPRRRTAPIAAIQPPFEDGRETTARLPKSVSARVTPYPGTLDAPMAMGQVALPMPQPTGKRPYVLYGLAGGGILMGMLGLFVGLRGGSEHAATPTPVVEVQPAPAAATMPPPTAPAKIEVSLDANVVNARVVFRRRVHEVPVKMEINATDVVELVEVSAPGHKTTRFWLTFDRPTHLVAQLAKGRGHYEATEEETLAALGEVIMVSDSAPTVAAASVTVPPVAKPTPAAQPSAAQRSVPPDPVPGALARRKIGRAAAEVEPAVEPAVEPDAAAPEPVADEPAPPAPVVQPPMEEAPKPEPVADAPVAAEPKLEVVRPAIDRATVSSVIGTYRPQVLKCFADGKKKNPALKGTLKLQLQVGSSGAVQRVQVQSTLDNPLVAACVVRAANGWKFPARPGGRPASVVYPFTFN